MGGLGFLVLTLATGAVLANWLWASPLPAPHTLAPSETPGKQSGHIAKGGSHARPAAGETPAKEAGHAAKGKVDTPRTTATTQPDPSLAYLGEGRCKLGEFSVNLFDPVMRSVLRVSFRLEGVIACDDEAAFQAFLKSSFRSLREQIQVAVRASDAPDFADPQLRVLRRRMIARVNRAFNGQFLRSVAVRDLAVHESIDRGPFVRWQAPALEP